MANDINQSQESTSSIAATTVANPPAPASTITPPTPVATTTTPVVTPPPVTTATVGDAPVNGGESSLDFSAFEAARDGQVTAPQTTPVSTTPAASTTPSPAASTISQQQPTATTPTTTPATAVGDKSLLDYTLMGEQAKTESTATTPTAYVPKFVGDRDYGGLDSTEEEHFKKMGNEAFAALKPAYLEYKALKPKAIQLEAELKTTKEQLAKVPQNGNLPESYYEHPASFVLNPQYLQTQSSLQTIDGEEQYWTKQLTELSAGRKPKDLIRNDQGQYFEGRELNADAATQAYLTTKISQVSGLKQQLQQQAGLIQHQHTLRYQQEMQALKQYEDQVFPWFRDGVKHPYEQFIQETMQKAPMLLRANPLVARMWAKAQALFTDMNKQIKQLKQQHSAPLTIAQQPLANTAGGGAPATSGAGKDDVTMDDFNRVLERV